ncbi:hypothetical protein [Spirosoma sp. KUDC1026]|uniref:hypothetical protein n=1 Tax=Spirosoma sp. KUDC1026 TaxID=2745947 RepID=UPI00159BE111|nr:hypothetical protein [Spirosoma sp. KUDC1026]QKZ11342.1 hypothetical protein HU175_01295 [Spirosoma sp. KUDC1026]
MAAGNYRLYALNYDTSKGVTGNTVNSTISSISGSCFDVSAAFPINVCPQDGSGCDYTVGTVSFVASGGNMATEYATSYVLTNADGVVTAISGTASFTVTTAGTYLAHGLNYRNDGTLAGLSVGQSLSTVTASCIDVGTPTIIQVCGPQYVTLLPKVYLQGALFGVNSPEVLMRDNLRMMNYLPTTSPYPSLGLTGLTSTTAVSPTIFATTGQDAIVDWVFVELRSATNNQQVVDSRSALVQRDGDIVAEDGVSPLRFNQVTSGNFYVAVKHRNHLGVMTSTAIPMSTTGTIVDFRTPLTPTYVLTAGNLSNQSQVIVDQGVALWAGNSLVDKNVIFQGTNNDVNAISQQVINAPGNTFVTPFYKLRGYYVGDINMNGETILQGTGNDVDFIFQNVIKNHPGNILKQNFFIIKEQLP